MLVVVTSDGRAQREVGGLAREAGCAARVVRAGFVSVRGESALELAARVGRVRGVRRVISLPYETPLVADARPRREAFTVIAGPCAVESLDALLEAADVASREGATHLRFGAFKGRTSPYSFRGLGEEALAFAAEVRGRFGLPLVAEVLSEAQVPAVAEAVDVLQIGSRNMHDASLLEAVGRAGAPVVLKRGFMATYEEFLLAAETLLLAGAPSVTLVERGIRTFEPSTRFTLDVACIPFVHSLCNLPIIADPSHSSGVSHLVTPLALAAVAAGADGLMVELHPEPTRALSDAAQALNFEEFHALMKAVRALLEAGGEIGASRAGHHVSATTSSTKKTRSSP